MPLKRRDLLFSSAALALGGTAAIRGRAALAAEDCVGKVSTLRVIVQPIPTTEFLQKVKGEFEEKWKTSVEFTVLGENERRSRSRLDASTGAGSYQVYYVDEANVSEFASAGWILPLEDHYPKEYDYADFLEGRKAVARYNGKAYFAPFEGGGDLMFYRKDVFAQKSLKAPKTLDEMIQVVQQLNQPPSMYGISLRGKRGFGMNVWRWTPYFRAFGGQWFEGDKPVFNSPAAVKAIELYMRLMKFAPPGVQTFTWSEVVEGMRAGQVGLLVESDVFGPWMEQKEKSRIAGKVGYAPPPDPLPSAGFAHGFAIAAKGNPDACSTMVAAQFVAWATSKEMEAKKVEAGIFSDVARQSTLDNPVFQKNVNPEYIQALKDAAPKTDLLIWRSALWPTVGDQLGLTLEELFTGSRTDIQGALDEVADFATDAVDRSKKG